MQKIVIVICSILLLNISLSAQTSDIVIVKAGTKVLDYFPLQERYRYQEFTNGKIVFKNGTVSATKLNYNILQGEIVFILSHDTLSIVRKKDIRHIVIAQDTFLFDNGYMELIQSGTFKVGLKQYVKVKDILKKGALGTTARGVSIDSYNSMTWGGSLYDLVPNEDIELQKMKEYFISTPSSGFVQFRKRFVMQLFPEKSDAIKGYLKSNKVDFDSMEDLLRFAKYLQSL